MVLGIVLAVVIFACLFATMVCVIYLYCRGKRREKETQLRAKLVLPDGYKTEVEQRQNYMPWTPKAGDTTLNTKGHEQDAGGDGVASSEDTPLITVNTAS